MGLFDLFGKKNTAANVQNEISREEYASIQSGKGCYLYWSGNYYEAYQPLKEAADMGNAAAQYTLGLCYDYGRGVEKNEQEAAKWYRLSAEQGDDGAQYRIGCCYCFGWGIEENEYEAVKWFRLSAEQGNADAQYELGFCYFTGSGVNTDHYEAVKLFRLSADQGNADAQYELGKCYYFGSGYCNAVDRDVNNAFYYLKLSVEQDSDNTDAQVLLGNCYQFGWGTPIDNYSAKMWYNKAAAAGNTDAQKCIYEMDHPVKSIIGDVFKGIFK